MKLRRFFFWSLITLASGLGAAEHCSSTDDESVLQTNHAYTYHFRSVALAQAVGTTEDKGKVVLDCSVRIFHDHSCYFNMELQNCKLTASGGEPGSESTWMDHKPLPNLSKYHVAFSLVGGEIKEVLVHQNDPLHFVNIKRGVLSAFVFKLSQTSQEIEEIHTDIHGSCPLKSVYQADGKVKTTKDMLHCNFPSRPDWQFSPWSMFWNMSFIQHVINSTTDCDYQINQKRVDSVYCWERHAIMLESTHRTTTAVQTNIFYNINFVKSEPQNSKPALPVLSRKTGITFEYEDTSVPQSSPPEFVRTATKMLSDLVLDSQDEIRLFTIPQFTDFVAWIRSSQDLTLLVDKVRNCDFLPDNAECDDGKKELAFSYLSDAFVQCNSLPCAKAITYIARNDDISPTYLNFIYRTWSYMHYNKPGFVTNFAELCKLKESKQCWLSLGTFAWRILSRSGDLDGKLVDEIRDVATHFHRRIEDDCEVTDGADSNHYTDCLIFLKAASNLGQYYGQQVPDGIGRLLEHATNDHSPTFVRTSALEAIKEVQYPKQYREIYHEILPLLKNASLPPSIRILAYDVLVPVSEEFHFEETLVGILKDEKSAEVKLYIADSLNSLFVDRDFRNKREKFLNALTELLQENRLSLEVILYETKGKSKSTSHSIFLNLPFMPKSMKKFGFKVLETTLFDAYTYPTILNQQSIVELFRKWIPVSKLGSYFEGWEELFLAYQKNLADMNLKPPAFSNIYEAIVKTLEEYGSKEDDNLLNFDKNILSNIKKIHQLHWQHHKKLNPYAKAYLDLFGSTIKYMVQDSFQQSSANKDLAKLMRYLRNDLEEGVNYNTTRVIRVIEAYHQVPTMMGLPLNWTTNATLAFSLRAGLKYKYDIQGNQIHSKGFLQPSVALTFLNRMVLDFPTITQIGVQANSSGYSSTDLRLQYNSVKGKQTFRLERPSRTQKVLELFRTNQLIKHNSYKDIADWDIERTSSSWCTKDKTSALEFCLSKSYPNVTHRMKPWALMAGWCKWQFLINPIDQGRVHYDIELQQAEKQRSQEYTAKFSVTEKEKEKATNFKLVMNENGKDMGFELKTSLSPNFLATLTSNEISGSKKISGKKVEALLKFQKDFKYEMKYSGEKRQQKPQLPPTKSSQPPDDNSQTEVSEEMFSLVTPYSAYRFNRTTFIQGGNEKTEGAVEYENLKSPSNWLRMILPPSLWADDRRATAKVLLNWKQPVHLSEESMTTRQTEFRLVLPRQTITLLGDSLNMKNREQLNVNIAKNNDEFGKLESFLNFTYDMWGNENEEGTSKEVRQANITIPRRSLAVVHNWAAEGRKYKHELKLRRVLMKPKDDQLNNYVGWWSEDSGDRFRLEEQEIKLVGDFEFHSLNPEEILTKYPQTLTEEDVKELGNSALDANVSLYYPFLDRVEKVMFDGYFIMSRGISTFRLQKTFDLTSTYNNLQLTSNSVYKSDIGSTIVSHHSYFTYLPSQTKAYHTIYYKSVQPEGKCTQHTFQHDIRSTVFDLSTDVSYKCDPDNDELYTLLLKVNTNSTKWNMLDINLDQIIQDVSPDYRREDMTLTHSLGTIHTDAEWHGKHKDLQKRFVICSKSGNCPNVELSIETSHEGKANFKLSLPNQNDTQITYERQMSSDYKTLHVKMGHSNKESKFTEFLDFTGEIIAPEFHVWKGIIDVKTANQVIELFQSAYQVARNSVVTAAKHRDHPLNAILQPTLKMTLYDYWHSVNKEVKNFFSLTWQEIKEAFYTLEDFKDPVYTVLSNTVTSICGLFRTAYNTVKEKSVTIWAINYFHLPYYFHQGFLYLPSGLRNLTQQLALQEEDVLLFKFMSGKIMSLGSFREWPSISFYPTWIRNLIQHKTDDNSPYRELDGRHKLAMIFGPLHVYTFDGHLYDIPAYPHKDCALLLAHDVHKSLFTVFSSEKGLHILFPEMSITIDDQNEVFLNGSSKPISLPIQSNNGKVTIKRGQTVEVWSPSLNIVCSDRHFLCVLKLKEFHNGGIIGILGNADGYSDNDFMLPNGNTTSSLLEYTRSYEISGKPECRNFVLSPKTAPSEEDDLSTTCQRAFDDVCYSRGHIRGRFLQSCISDVRAGHGPCYAAGGLSALCSFQYMASHTNCNTKKQERKQIGRNLEVMLVVQESKHLTSAEHSSAPTKGIESLLRALDVQFKDSGYDSVLYSLVAFGGNGVHYPPSIHSSRKDLWVPVDDMINDVLKTLEFKSTEDADSVLALRYALDELGYDSFNSKVVIVVTVKDRQVAEKYLTTNIQRQLEENGITLYTISSYPSIEKGKKVFGVRADGLIFPSQTKGGDAYLDYPRGNLAKLTSSTRGSLFLSKFLSDNKPPTFFTEFAQEVWAKVGKETQKCRLCSSVKAGWWWYRNQCAIVHC